MKKAVTISSLPNPTGLDAEKLQKAMALVAKSAEKLKKQGFVLKPAEVMTMRMSPEFEAEFKKKMAEDAALRSKPPQPPHPTIVIKSILQDHLAPYLKDKGFRKKGRHFWRVQGDIVDVLDLQSSQFNDAWKAKFTINLHVGWLSIQQVIGGPFVMEPLPPKTCIFKHRLTPDMEKKADHWWHVRSDTDKAQVAKEIFEMLEARGFPWMESKRDRKLIHEEVTKRWPLRAKELKAVLARGKTP